MSMSFNQVKTGTLVPYINSQIENSLKRAFKSETKFWYEKTTLYFNDSNGGGKTINQVSNVDGPATLFAATVLPTFQKDTCNWMASVDPTNDQFGIIKYNGKKTQVEVELSYKGDADGTSEFLTVQLYVSGFNASANYTGGRGWGSDTTAKVIDKTGSGAVLKVIVSPTGNITSINVLKGGGDYSPHAHVQIYGCGIEASATVSLANTAVTNVTLVNYKIDETGFPIQYLTQNKIKCYDGSQNYIFTLLPNDTIEGRIISANAGVRYCTRL